MQHHEPLNPHQKLALAMVVLIAIVSLCIYFGFYVKKSIAGPFVSRNYVEFKTADELEKERLEAMKSKDTDGDTLSDFDETYLYRTNPYLDDTDSDGLLDQDEIANNTDPNCAQGADCYASRPKVTVGTAIGATTGIGGETTADPGTTTLPPVETADKATLAVLKTFGDVTKLSVEDVERRVSELTPTQIREFFVSIGMKKSDIDKQSDETLRRVLVDTMTEIIAASQPEAAPQQQP